MLINNFSTIVNNMEVDRRDVHFGSVNALHTENRQQIIVKPMATKSLRYYLTN